MPINRLRAQLWNQLDWMSSRGISGSFPKLNKLFADGNIDYQDPDLSSGDPIGAQTRQKFALGFFAGQALLAKEQDMLNRIIKALGFELNSVLVSSNNVEAKDIFRRCRYVVALGVKSGQLLLPLDANPMQSAQLSRQLVTIPHPGAMLLEPSLKIAAWATLQQLKLALSC